MAGGGSEVLRTMASSPTDVTPVLQGVAERAVRLCDADDVRILVADGDVLVHAASSGPVRFGGETQPIPIDRRFVAGRAYGRIRAILDDRGRIIDQAGPATPMRSPTR